MVDNFDGGPLGDDESRAVEKAERSLAGFGERLGEIERLLALLVERDATQEFYSTADAASRLGRAEFTVREWCRHGRVMAEKRPCGRGRSREWMIPHAELERVRSEGLRPLPEPNWDLRSNPESGRIAR